MVRKKSGLSGSDKYERQKLLARERQRKRRAKLDPDQLKKRQEYNKNYYNKLKEEKKIKSISEMTPREARKRRQCWRRANKTRRDKQKALEGTLNNTPPSSPAPSDHESRQKKKGRKVLKANRTKAYRTIKSQEEKIKNLVSQLDKYKKRYYREKNKKPNTTSPSPRKETKELVGRDKVSPQVKKRLFLGLVLEKQLLAKMKENVKTKKKNQLYRKVLGNKIIKKYRVQKYFHKLLPYKSNKFLNQNENPEIYTRKPRNGCLLKQHSKAIVRFFECDTVSRMCPGKKDYIKNGKLRKQRRVLLDTMENLYNRFILETKIKVSLRSFYRARPYWVTFPRKCDRDTCACVRHTNMDLLTLALKRNGLIQGKNLQDIVDETVCSSVNKDCMFGDCPACKTKTVVFNVQDKGESKIKYFQWMNIKEKKDIKGKTRFVNKTVKVRKTQKINELVHDFNKQLPQFKVHLFRSYHQAKELKNKILNLSKNEILFRIDFSENYVGKYSLEIQSAHFGASKKQIALNTGVFYYVKNDTIVKVPFATASDNLDHQAHAVWAHMEPIFKKAVQLCPNISTVHFYSDSPSSQYRNRINVHFMKELMPKYFVKLQRMTWSFTEAGHGKGPMDGVGGFLKREADRKVHYGMDITNAAEFVDTLKNCSNVLLLEINPRKVELFKEKFSPKDILQIKGIMKVYQITFANGFMMARSLACFECLASQTCQHDYDLFEIFPQEESEDEELLEEVISNKKRLSIKEVYSSDEEYVPVPLSSQPSCSTGHQDSDEELAKRIQEEETEDEEDEVRAAQVGSWVLVKFSTKKTVKHFVGQIIDLNQDSDDYLVKFVKKCGSIFQWPDKEDLSIVPRDDIVIVLPEPKPDRRGAVIFKMKFDGFHIQ